MRLLLTVLLLLLAAACTTPRVRVEPTVVSDTQTRALIAHATAEWIRWGRRVARTDPGSAACLVQPGGVCAEIADGCGDEQSAALCPLVDEYWQTVPPHIGRHSCGQVDVCAVQWPAQDPRRPETTPAWSAAFVSAMLARAGFAPSEIQPSMTHAGYIVPARELYTSAFEVVPTPAVAVPGDIVCATRADARVTPADVARIEDGRQSPPLHCDIVVEVDPAARVLHAIGGNVQQTVARIEIKLDAQGRVTYTAGAPRPWILVLRARK
jgi:hypothetical protein